MTDATTDQTMTDARAAERDEVMDKARRAKAVSLELARYTSERFPSQLCYLCKG